MAQKEKDLDIFDVWESPNGNHFIKINNECSIAIGTKDGDGYLQGKPANTPLTNWK